MLRHQIITFLAVIKAKFDSYKEYLRNRTANFSEVSFDIIIICVAGFLLLYYPVGAFLTHNIDRSTDTEISNGTPNQSQTVEMISYLVNREVNDKIWTPNLPFFFPASILDNMPNYQLGMMNGISKFTTAFEKRVDSTIHDKENTSKLYKAAVLLRYSGTIWMFDPHNKIKPVPSAGSQYRKARRQLIKYNQSLISGQNVFYKNPLDLAYMLKKSKVNLAQSSRQLAASIRENSSNFFDFKADDVFYYNQGKVYAYYMLFRALGQDYKDIIVNAGQYQNWISLTKALEEACAIQPAIIRNGELNSVFAPNHLSYLNANILKAQNLIDALIPHFNLPEGKR